MNTSGRHRRSSLRKSACRTHCTGHPASEAESLMHRYVAHIHRSCMSAVNEAKQKVTLSVPLLHTKVRSRKYQDKIVTRGYYLNVPQAIVEGMKLKDKELLQVTIQKVK